MSETMNQQVLLSSRPFGEPTEANFELVTAPVQSPGPGQVLRRTIYLSLDPYMRGRMNAGRSYAQPVKPGQVMVGGTVSQVVESNRPDFAAGDFVLGGDGWQSYGLSDGADLEKIDPAVYGRISYALGLLGMPGLTAYVGLLDVGKPAQGETVVVSSAAGAVGQVASQIALIKECRVVGVAGSDEKCKFLADELGLHAAVNYRADDLLRALKEACPDGIDVYFENVGGKLLDTVLRLINRGARIPLIGLISQYNETSPPPGPSLIPLLVKRALIQGILVSDHAARKADFLRDVSSWVREGRIKYREHIVAGLTNAPPAFIGMFHGANFGKLLVGVSDDPTA